MYGPATSGNHKIPDFMVTGFGGLGDEEDGHGDVGDVGDGDVVDDGDGDDGDDDDGDVDEEDDSGCMGLLLPVTVKCRILWLPGLGGLGDKDVDGDDVDAGDGEDGDDEDEDEDDDDDDDLGCTGLLLPVTVKIRILWLPGLGVR